MAFRSEWLRPSRKTQNITPDPEKVPGGFSEYDISILIDTKPIGAMRINAITQKVFSIDSVYLWRLVTEKKQLSLQIRYGAYPLLCEALNSSIKIKKNDPSPYYMTPSYGGAFQLAFSALRQNVGVGAYLSLPFKTIITMPTSRSPGIISMYLA